MYATLLSFSPGAWGWSSDPKRLCGKYFIDPSPQPQSLRLKYFPSPETLSGLWEDTEPTTQFIDTVFQLALSLMPQLPLQ